MSNSTAIRLVGLDFGSTTTSGVVARAMLRSGLERRSELAEVTIEHRSPAVFTPFVGEALDEPRLAAWLDDWARSAGIGDATRGGHDFHGGAIVTGLAAQASNARIVRQLVQARLGQTLIATAGDPALESWLAFMGNCRPLSLAQPATQFLNLDIGGGTTNVALGQGGDVRQVGCYQLGARHIRFQPGSYRIVGLSHVGRRLLKDLRIDRREGETLNAGELTALVEYIVRALEALVQGGVREALGQAVAYLQDVPFETLPQSPMITFSGGVGELVYRAALGDDLPGTTAFGDLGIDLAHRICRSPLLSCSLTEAIPTALGRATVLGLAIHHVELSGATIFLPDRSLLPLAELPIVGRLSAECGRDEIAAALALVGRSASGGCLGCELADATYQNVRLLGERLAAVIEAAQLPADRPLVILVNQNVGQALGNYATRWSQLPASVIVLDELPDRRAAFVTIGRPQGPVVPCSFYGV